MKRTYNIPLRREFLKAPLYKRSNKAIKAVIKFLEKHMKSTNVKIGRHLNEKVWQNGIKNPPHHVEIVAIKDADGAVKAELVEFEKEIMPKADKKDKATSKAKETKTEEAPVKEAEPVVEEKAESKPAKEAKPKKEE